MVSQVKLIAEPWDVGEGGYQVGNFPPLWSEWNGKLPRHRARLLAGRAGDRSASSPTGSPAAPTCTRPTRRRPSASVNFVTAHDGFTLRDLVSYNEKHNEANGEDNRDGESHNRSWNCGVEGPTDDPDDRWRCGARQQRNLLTTLFLSQGVPMLLAGDEIGPHPGRQQQRLLPGQRDLLVRLGRRSTSDLLDFTRGADRPAPRPPGVPPPPLVPGAADAGHGADIAWFKPDGTEMTEDDWDEGHARPASACSSTATPSRRPGPRGERIVDDSVPPALQRVARAAASGRSAGRGASAGTASSTPRTARPSEGDEEVAGRGRAGRPLDPRPAPARRRTVDRVRLPP